MGEFNIVELLLSFLITWTIGLTPPLFMKYIFPKKPFIKSTAVGVCVLLWVMNLFIFEALGSKSQSHFALILIAFVSYNILKEKGLPKDHPDYNRYFKQQGYGSENENN